METIGKLKDNFKNFEKKFQNEIYDKKEFTKSATVENDFIRVYYIKTNNKHESIGFAVNNTTKTINGYAVEKDKLQFYNNLFKKVMENNNTYENIKEFYIQDKDNFINICSEIDQLNKHKYYNFNSNIVNEMINLTSIQEIITVSFRDDKDKIYSKNYNFEEFKEQFKKFIKNEELIDPKTFIKVFNLSVNDRDIIKENVIDKFVNDNKEFLSEYVDIKDKKEVAIKEFKDCNKEYEKLMKEYSNKIKKELGYDKFYETQQNLISATIDLDRKLYGSIYNPINIVKDYYYDNQNLNSNIGFNSFKSDITKRINDLSKDDFVEKSILEENLDFMRGR